MGYASEAYGEACLDHGTPRRLSASGGTVLLRRIAGTPFMDATGCYPLFSCQRWDRLAADVSELARDCVSLVLVADPFAPVDPTYLGTIFDRVVSFKNHYVADLNIDPRVFVSGKRLRSARSTLRGMTVEVVDHPSEIVDDWLRLQGELQRRHAVKGERLLSREGTARLFAMPGIIVLRASLEGVLLGLHVDILENGVVYAHLAAYSREGYAANASSALNVFEIDFFKGKARWIDWGGNAGHAENADDGLARFKSRYATGTVPVYLCGKILQRDRYDALARAHLSSNPAFFPAYRAGETA